MLKSRQFLSVYVMAILSFFLGIFAVGSFKVYGENNGISESLLTTVGSVGAIFNAARFFWSGMLDRFSYRWVYGSLLLLEMVFGVVIVITRKSPIMYTLSYCVIMFCEGGHFTLVPNILKQIFGSKATQLYGFGFSYTGMCAVIQILVQNAFLNSKTYNYFFLGGAALAGVSFILLFTCFTDKKFHTEK